MGSDSLTVIERLVFVGFGATLALWAGVSSFVVVNRMLYDRRQRRWVDIARALTDPSVASLPPLDRSPAIRRILSRLSRRAVYGMVASDEFPIWVTDVCAAYTLEHVGLPRMLHDASVNKLGRKWRRIAALFALGHLRADGVHEALHTAVCDPDPEISEAAAVILHRLGDQAAAGILIEALRDATLSRSRIATHLDQFPAPIHELLRPLLHDPRPVTRYWGASLLHRYPNVPGLASEIAQAANDPDPSVRKAALMTLGVMGATAVPLALHRLEDGTAYVRSTAVRVLGRQGAQEPEESRRLALASRIAPMMADAAWEVRLAAKEALVELGPTVWRQVAVQLESHDEFARNGAAEVLQNLGILDWTLREYASGSIPSTELTDVLARAFHEGGPALADAAVARAQEESLPGVERLVADLQFVGATP